LNRKIAKVSNTPGRTRQLNYFDLANKLHIVDLPGYGYAKASKREVAGWNQLIYDYLRGRVQLKRIFLLVDSRHGIKKNDLEMIKFLGNYPNTTQIILTKTDKIGHSQSKTVIDEMTMEISKHAICHNQIIMTSSITRNGIQELREAIFNIL
jgi:GTP-binding protein